MTELVAVKSLKLPKSSVWVSPGETFECPEPLVDDVLSAGIAAHPEVEEDEGAQAPTTVAEAILTLDRSKPADQFTASGLPNATVLRQILGRPVSSQERDAAWEEVKDQFDG